MYTRIVFNYDKWDKEYLGFDIYMLSEELSVEYTNNAGGFTQNGVRLTTPQYKKIKRLSDPILFEPLRDYNGPVMDLFTPSTWKVQFLSNDGKTMLILHDHNVPCGMPQVLRELVSYVVSIGTLGNLSRELLDLSK